MLQLLVFDFTHALNHIHPPVALVIAAVGLLIGLAGARFSRSIIALSLVSAGTVIGLHMPRWFGWGIDPMGTAFGMAILLGMSGYVLSTLWEGILLSTLLACISGATAWMTLAPQAVWLWPHVDFSGTAMEIGYAIWQSLPVAINRALPVATGIGATIGTLLMVFAPRAGRVLFYAIVGMAVFLFAALLAVRQLVPQSIMIPPNDSWVRGVIFCISVLFSAGVQWLVLPKTKDATLSYRSDKSLAANQFVANGPAMRVQSRGSGFGSGMPARDPAIDGRYKLPEKIR